MLKVWGAGLIAAAGLYGILLRKRECKASEMQLRQWTELLEVLRSEIRWHHVSLSEFLMRQPMTSSIMQYMKRKYTLQQAWEKITDDIGDKDVKNILKSLYFSGDQQYLLANIGLTVERLRELDSSRQQKASVQGRIQSAAIFSAAGLLIIILL